MAPAGLIAALALHRVDRLDSQRRRLRRNLWQSADESKYRAALA